jgi:hypothetical protein
MPDIKLHLSGHTYELLKLLVGSEEDYRGGLTARDQAAWAELAASHLLEWAIRGLCGAPAPAPYRTPLTLEGKETTGV